MQAVACEQSQLTQKTLLGSLRHRSKLPNTSLNHEKAAAFVPVSLRNVLPLSLPDSEACASVCASIAAGIGKDFSSKALPGLCFHTKRHIHQLRWHF